MLRMPAVSHLALRRQLSLTGIGGRRSPIEIVATMGTFVTRTQAAEVSGLRAGSFGRWADGVTAMREDCVTFASHWQAHNERVLSQSAAGQLDGSSWEDEAAGAGPLWVVLGDSTAQGLGAPTPEAGYVGQVLGVLRERSGLPWRVLNLSVSGALIGDVLTGQLPRMPASAKLVTCGVGVNDILYTKPGKLFSDLRALLAAVPDHTVVLDLPVPARYGGLIGWASLPYVARINRTIHAIAADRGLPVAEVSAHFIPPWTGKMAADCFHPSQDGYRDWAQALLAVL
jgi:acyl-CoA thioesterase I